jgi:hypothetical protein
MVGAGGVLPQLRAVRSRQGAERSGERAREGPVVEMRHVLVSCSLASMHDYEHFQNDVWDDITGTKFRTR